MDLVLDGREILVERDFHRALNLAFDFGPHYGWNRAALWDRLSRDLERPVKIVWQHSAVSAEALGAAVFVELCLLIAAVAESDIADGYEHRLEFFLC
jgi:ribonuclease inhibitor